MVLYFFLTQAPVSPGGDQNSIIALAALGASALTVVATAILNRRKGKSDFSGEVLKENEYLRARVHGLEKQNASLKEQNEILGLENVRLLRKEHDGLLVRLERLVRGVNISRTGEAGTSSKLDEIHDLVNDRLDRALREISDLKDRLEGGDR